EDAQIIEGKGKQIPRGTKTSLRALLKRGLVRQVPFLQPFREQQAFTAMLRLTPDQGKVEKFLAGQGRKKPAQAVTLMRLQGSEDASLSAMEIKALGQVSDATVKALVTAGLHEPVEEGDVEKLKPPTPNEHQQKAIDAIGELISGHEFGRFLLYGITGSGK